MKEILREKLTRLDRANWKDATRHYEHGEMEQEFYSRTECPEFKCSVATDLKELAVTNFADDEIPEIMMPVNDAERFVNIGGERHKKLESRPLVQKFRVTVDNEPFSTLHMVMKPYRKYADDLELEKIQATFYSSRYGLACMIRLYESHTEIGAVRKNADAKKSTLALDEMDIVRPLDDPHHIEGWFDLGVYWFYGTDGYPLVIDTTGIRDVSLDCIGYDDVFHTASWCARLWNGMQMQMKREQASS